MKKLVLAVIALTLIFTSCSNESKIKNTVEKYHESLLKADFESAKKYCTEESAEFLDLLIQHVDEDMKKEWLEETKDVKFKLKEVKMGEDKKTAEAIYEIQTAPGKTDEQVYKLVKEDGNWLIATEK